MSEKQYAVLSRKRGGKRRFIVAYLTGSTKGGGPIYQQVRDNLTQQEAYALLAELKAGKNPGRRRKRTTKRRAKKLKDFPVTVIGDLKHAAAQRETIRRLLRRNPGRSESEAWTVVMKNARAIINSAKKYPNSVDAGAVQNAWNILTVANEMAFQVAHGVHHNPAIAVLGNPGDSAAGTLSDRVYEVRYRHAQDGRDYKHPFGPGVRATLLKDGRVVLWHPSKRIWKDFA